MAPLEGPLKVREGNIRRLDDLLNILPSFRWITSHVAFDERLPDCDKPQGGWRCLRTCHGFHSLPADPAPSLCGDNGQNNMRRSCPINVDGISRNLCVPA